MKLRHNYDIYEVCELLLLPSLLLRVLLFWCHEFIRVYSGCKRPPSACGTELERGGTGSVDIIARDYIFRFGSKGQFG